jgi:hypothetical protein
MGEVGRIGEHTMVVRHEVITPAQAKRYISTYSEHNGYMNVSDEYRQLQQTLVEENYRKPKARRNPAYQHTICINTQGTLIKDLQPLFDIIAKRRPTELYICVVDNAEEIEDILADVDLETFPNIDGLGEHRLPDER